MNRDVGHLLVQAWELQTGGNPAGTYDEVLREVSQRATENGSLGKADIGAMVLWKRINAQTRWAKSLLELPDATIRQATANAYVLANDDSAAIPEAGQAARVAIRDVPGMGGTAALASAILVALAPDRMAVWDRRVGESLQALGRRPKSGDGFYGRYLQVAVDLAEHMNETREHAAFVPRDVDLALYCVAGSDSLLGQAQALA